MLNDLDRSDGSAGLLVAAGASPAVFIAPVIGALAPDFNMLIAARLVQGAGGAGLINLALVLIADNWDGLERTRLIGRNSAVLTTALALLPSVSGVVAEVTSCGSRSPSASWHSRWPQSAWSCCQTFAPGPQPPSATSCGGRPRGVVALRLLLTASSFFIAVAAFGLAAAPTLAMVLVAMLLYGFGDGSLIPALQDVATSIPGADQRASVLGAWVVAVRAGQTIGPLGAALLFATYSTEVAMVVGAGIFVAVGLLFLFGPVDDAATAGRPATVDR